MIAADERIHSREAVHRAAHQAIAPVIAVGALGHRDVALDLAIVDDVMVGCRSVFENDGVSAGDQTVIGHTGLARAAAVEGEQADAELVGCGVVGQSADDRAVIGKGAIAAQADSGGGIQNVLQRRTAIDVSPFRCRAVCLDDPGIGEDARCVAHADIVVDAGSAPDAESLVAVGDGSDISAIDCGSAFIDGDGRAERGIGVDFAAIGQDEIRRRTDRYGPVVVVVRIDHGFDIDQPVIDEVVDIVHSHAARFTGRAFGCGDHLTVIREDTGVV